MELSSDIIRSTMECGIQYSNNAEDEDNKVVKLKGVSSGYSFCSLDDTELYFSRNSVKNAEIFGLSPLETMGECQSNFETLPEEQLSEISKEGNCAEIEDGASEDVLIEDDIEIEVGLDAEDFEDDIDVEMEDDLLEAEDDVEIEVDLNDSEDEGVLPDEVKAEAGAVSEEDDIEIEVDSNDEEFEDDIEVDLDLEEDIDITVDIEDSVKVDSIEERVEEVSNHMGTLPSLVPDAYLEPNYRPRQRMSRHEMENEQSYEVAVGKECVQPEPVVNSSKDDSEPLKTENKVGDEVVFVQGWTIVEYLRRNKGNPTASLETTVRKYFPEKEIRRAIDSVVTLHKGRLRI